MDEDCLMTVRFFLLTALTHDKLTYGAKAGVKMFVWAEKSMG